MCACLWAAAVVLVFDRLPGHALLLVRVLLGGKDGGEEELLQLLAGKVDAELLEGVHVQPNHGCQGRAEAVPAREGR